METNREDTYTGLGLLVLRLGVGLMMFFSHGLGKLMGGLELAKKFPDPLGVGSQLSWFLAMGAETVCALLIVLGLMTRLASIPLAVTMLVAAFVVHGDDPFQKKEFALLYLVPFITLALSGAGKFSLDSVLRSGKASKEAV